MACGDDLRTQLSRYVDGELASEERARVDEHVAICAPCRELLQIFQKNESLLSNALSTESFGNAVIESVIKQIKDEAPPVEIRPIEETNFRFRPALALAAAALLVVALVVVLNQSHSREIDKLTAQMTTQSERVQALKEITAKQSADYENLIIGMRVQDTMHDAPERRIAGFFTPQHLIVRASFDLKLYGAFSVYRRGEGESNDRFAKMNGERRLESPEYTDATVKPGNAYVYKFRAYRTAKDEEFVESLPVTMRLPRIQEISPAQGIQVQCVDIGVTHKVAKFLLHRIVNGRTFSEEFVIKPGERLGDVREVPGFGKIDFRTTLTLDKLEDGNQTMPIRFTRAMLDDNGKEVIERFKDGSVEVKTVEDDGVLSIRPNLRAFFRTAGAATAEVDLWKGSWIQVRAQE
jgi:hypothetical protein